ncbi:hypothetical protein D3C73_1117600 [compost metagenome]
MDIEPREGAYVSISTQKSLSWRINCRDLRNGTFRLIFSCDRLNQRLALECRLITPPPILLYPVTGDPRVEVQPLLHGTGTPSAQIIIHGGDGRVLARTTVADDGKWAVRFAQALSEGPHTFLVTQRNTDATESSAAPVEVVVKPGFALVPVILAPASGSTVYVKSWVEGLGLPGCEVRLQRSNFSTVFAQGLVNADGRWRIQLKSTVAPGAYSTNVAMFVDGAMVSDWSPNYMLELIARTQG